jgi:energy-coupling factor transporter ATP-binding protein EcfA2
MSLNEKQQQAFDTIKAGHNVFLTGPAGTGKSYLIHYLKKYLDVDVTASTGIAANHLGGQTVFSWGAFFPIPALEAYGQKEIPYIRERIKKCSRLIIDEISMIDAEFFDYIDVSLKAMRHDTRPFGGLQIIAVGDFMQLPPASKNPKYCFESKAWDEALFEPVKLTEIKRQEDANMAALLNRMQINQMKNEDIELLKARNIDTPFDDDVVQLFPLNKYADSVNHKKLFALQAEVKNYYAQKEADPFAHPKQAEVGISKFIKDSLIEDRLILKEGARVMMLSNEYLESQRVSNGSTGEVLAMNDHVVLVGFDNGVTLEIERKTYEVKMKNIKTRKEVKLGTVTQFPLKLCWAITIHKSQGMSLDRLAIDFKGIFAPFQAYVALSRARSLDGVQIKNFDPKYIKIDQKAVDFMNSIK